MSDLSAAAKALGVPEPIVRRSAEARAEETGASVEEILAAWAGGGSAPSAPPVEAAPPGAAEPEEVELPAEEPSPRTEAAPEPAPAAPPTPPPTPGATPSPPPVLVAEPDHPMLVLAGALGLFLAVSLIGLVGPSLPAEKPGARTSEIQLSSGAERGRAVYQAVGCAACHTQMVRPVVADVGLGAVTLDDSNQVLGTRRFGPDLSNVGARLDPTELQARIGGAGGHPSLRLSAEDLSDLLAYLSESRTMEPEEAPAEEPAES